MPEPWRVAVIGPELYPHSNSRVYSRLKKLQNDFPKATFHVITSTSAGVASAALRAAKKLGMMYTAVTPEAAWPEWERMIAYWDFEHEGVRDLIRISVLSDLHTEIYDRDYKPIGAAAAEAVMA